MSIKNKTLSFYPLKTPLVVAFLRDFFFYRKHDQAPPQCLIDNDQERIHFSIFVTDASIELSCHFIKEVCLGGGLVCLPLSESVSLRKVKHDECIPSLYC